MKNKRRLFYTFIMDPFIAPSHNISSTSKAEWQYYANLSKEDIQKRWNSPRGQILIKDLLAGGFSRQALELHVGKFDGKFDLRGIPFSNGNLSNLDLSDIDFFVADFSGTSFKNSNLSGSYLSECNLSGAIFDWAKLDEALLDNVKYDHKTSFLGVKLHTVNFTLATLLYDLALSQQRIQQLQEHHKWFALFLRISSDYGRSFSRYFMWVASFIFSYALIYFFIDSVPGTRTFIDYLYFSVVTFATVGYGDIVMASTVGKLVVISEILLGYLMGGLLVAILAKRVIG